MRPYADFNSLALVAQRRRGTQRTLKTPSTLESVVVVFMVAAVRGHKFNPAAKTRRGLEEKTTSIHHAKGFQALLLRPPRCDQQAEAAVPFRPSDPQVGEPYLKLTPDGRRRDGGIHFESNSIHIILW